MNNDTLLKKKGEKHYLALSLLFVLFEHFKNENTLSEVVPADDLLLHGHHSFCPKAK